MSRVLACVLSSFFLPITPLILGVKSGDWAGLGLGRVISNHVFHCWQIFNNFSPKTNRKICLLQSYDTNLTENQLVLL